MKQHLSRIFYRLFVFGFSACFFISTPALLSAQPVIPFSREASSAYRQKIYRNLVQNIIQKNLLRPLTPDTEDQWTDALQAMLLLQYRSDWSNQRLHESASELSRLSMNMQKSFFEYLYALQISGYGKWAYNILQQQSDPACIAVITHYLLSVDSGDAGLKDIINTTGNKLKDHLSDPVIESIQYELGKPDNKQQSAIDELFSPAYLPGQVFLLCLQRTDRNYPGLCLIRDSAGHWLRDSTGDLFTISMLARSQNNLPGYLANGNTPEGLFRMDGFGQSKSGFIGPSTNIQLTMPFEYKAGHFFRDSTLADSAWQIENYARLLPPGLRNHFPAYQSYRAGKAGRREIIMHGSTVDPAWYRSAPYYPLTPTQGCLTTRESWDPESGVRLQSDQQALVDLVIQAGGPNGYVMVLNLDNKKSAVSLQDLRLLMQEAGIR